MQNRRRIAVAGALALILGSASLIAGAHAQAQSQYGGQASAKNLTDSSETAGGRRSEKPKTQRPKVVTTTAILADLAKNVAGDRVEVQALIPPGADPHSYEPTLRNVRSVAYAQAAFSNYMLLEEQNVIRTIDANLRPGMPNISLAEQAAKYGATLIPLVENLSLDTIWLGLRVRGNGADLGIGRSGEARLVAKKITGPGELYAYVTGTFGQPEVFYSTNASALSSRAPTGSAGQASLPLDAHMHMSWAFTKPGVYQLSLEAQVAAHSSGETKTVLGPKTVVFAVGIDPNEVPQRVGATVLDSGHADVSVNLADKTIEIYGDEKGSTRPRSYDPATTVISVPSKALLEIPAESRMRFLGKPNTSIYQLPQAVLGKHIHGEIDPHLWQDVKNAMAYVKIIRDVLIRLDPEGREIFETNTRNYLAKLSDTDQYLQETIAKIPPSRRHLITTHDAYGYLAKAYGLQVSGFVTPNPGVEPSVHDLVKLSQTLDNLKVGAVFVEPNLALNAGSLTQMAQAKNIKVCRLYGDAFDEHVNTYLAMMRANGDSLYECLKGNK